MTEPLKYDENTPPEDVKTNVVDGEDPTVEISKNQNPEPDFDEEDD